MKPLNLITGYLAMMMVFILIAPPVFPEPPWLRIAFSLDITDPLRPDCYEYFQGMPIGFYVNLINGADAIIEDRRQRVKELKKQRKLSDYEKKELTDIQEEIKKLEEFQTITVGTKERPWFHNMHFRIGKVKGKALMSNVDWTKNLVFHSGDYGLGPEPFEGFWMTEPQVTEMLEPGEYEVRAIFNSLTHARKFPSLWSGRLESKSKKISIRKVGTNSDKARVYMSLAWYHEQKMSNDDVLKCAMLALQLDPAIPGPHIALCSVYERQGDFKKALEECKKWLEKYDKLPDRDRLPYPDGVYARMGGLEKKLAEQQGK